MANISQAAFLQTLLRACAKIDPSTGRARVSAESGPVIVIAHLRTSPGTCKGVV